MNIYHCVPPPAIFDLLVPLVICPIALFQMHNIKQLNLLTSYGIKFLEEDPSPGLTNAFKPSKNLCNILILLFETD